MPSQNWEVQTASDQELEKITAVIAGFILRSAKAAAKKELKPMVKHLRSSIKKRKGWGEWGDPPAKRTGKRLARKHIQTRTKFQGVAKKGLSNKPMAFAKTKAWTPIQNVLSNTHGWAYRRLPYDTAEREINLDKLSHVILSKAERGYNGFIQRKWKDGTMIKFPKAMIIDMNPP